MGQALGNEMYACGVDVILGPNVEIQRDPLCGRAYECFGEDPYLVGKIAAAEVQGIQSQGVAACLKHFALYGGVESGKEYNTVDMSRVRMMNQYLPPYEAVVKAGVCLLYTSPSPRDS